MRRVLLLFLGLALLVKIAQAETVQPAVPLDRSPPEYPAGAGDAEGYVRLHFGISANGHIENAAIIESSPKSLFDQAALNAVSRWTYHPRIVDGRAVDQPDNTILLRFKPAPAPAQPKALFAPQPSYPKAAYDAHLEGTVRVGFDVTDTGMTTNVHVLESSPPSIFDGEAIRGVKDWMFEPLAVEGKPQVTPGLSTVIPFKLADARVRPKPVKINPPLYPSEAEHAGIMGACNIDFIIEPDGTVGNPQIHMCVPRGVFERASLNSIKTWIFEPVRGPSGNVAAPACYTINFRMQGTTARDIQYLRPGQWIKLKYTLLPDGTAKNVEVIEKSDPDLGARRAIEQVRMTHFAPIIENGIAVEKPDQEVRIYGK